MEPLNPPTTRTKPLTVLGIAFLLGVVFNLFFFDKLPGVSFLLFIALILLGLAALAKVFHQNLPRQTYLLMLPLLFFAAMVFVRSSGTLTALNILASLILLLLLTVSVLGQRLDHYMITDYVKLVAIPFKILRTSLATTAEMITLRSPSTTRSRAPQILAGIGLALPILVLFIFLFSAADLVFAKYVHNLVNIEINMETVARVLLILAVTFVFIGAYVYTLRARVRGSDPDGEQPNARSLALLTTSILLASVNALFLMFVFIQITYLFGGQASIAAQGFTYAEYARKGFFELLTVAVIAFVILQATEKYTTKGVSSHTRLFKFFSGLLVFQVMLIIVSAFKRLVLYEQAYGFTMLRLLSHVFTIWLAVIFLLLLYKIFIDGSERKFLFYVFLSVIAMLTILNIGNPDAFIAQRNIARYEATGKLDTVYLTTLSEDALGPLAQAFNGGTPALKSAIGQQLYRDLFTKANSSWSNSWPSTNLARRKGGEFFKSHLSELEQYKDYPGEGPQSHI